MTIKEKIDDVFDLAENQAQAIIGIYSLVIPDWYRVKEIKKWPSVSREFSEYLFNSFIKFDKENHPEVMAGGLWMNNGFSTNENLKGWAIDLSTCDIIYNRF